MPRQMPTFAVFTNNRHFLGYVTAAGHKAACLRAERKFGYGLDVELSTNAKPRPSDRLNANVEYEAKTARRYPTDGFAARREAEIAAWKAANA